MKAMLAALLVVITTIGGIALYEYATKPAGVQGLSTACMHTRCDEGAIRVERGGVCYCARPVVCM
jgi:hypothetical protein